MSNPPNKHHKKTASDQVLVEIDVVAELETMLIAEQIFRDYQDILKTSVIPRITEEYKLKIRDMRILACVAKHDGRATSADIATILRQDPATITRSMVTLIGLGFVTTSESFGDARSRVIQLTDKGKEAIKDYFALVRKAITTATIIDETFLSSDNLRSTRNITSKLAKRVSRLSRNLRLRSRSNR